MDKEKIEKIRELQNEIAKCEQELKLLENAKGIDQDENGYVTIESAKITSFKVPANEILNIISAEETRVIQKINDLLKKITLK